MTTVLPHDGAIHSWFGLSYANYLVLNRSTLQSMPLDWQERFVALLQELWETPFDVTYPPSYDVRCRSEDGRFMADPVPQYNRGRTRIPLKGTATP